MRKMVKNIVFLLLLAMFGTTLIAAQQQMNVKTLFHILPADAFRLLPSDDSNNLEQFIKVCDYKNGYLSLELENQSKWEMCYWNLKNGNKLIATSQSGTYFFYLYNKGKITPTTEFGIDKMNREIEESIVMNCCDNWINFHLPRQGTSIYLTINGLESQIYKWQNEKFVRFDRYLIKNNLHQQLVKNFVIALNTADADRCLQYVLPNYVSEQCMGVFEGDKEQFLCDLISGEDEKGYIKPKKLSDIKKATYRYTPNDGFANHTIFIELKNGRSYTFFVSLETVDVFEILPGGETDKLLKRIPYIVGGMG